MSAPNEPRYKTLEAMLGYTFENPALLQEALTHHTYVEEHPRLGRADNERLEFLGDTFIEMVVRRSLLHAFPHAPKGALNPIKQRIVKDENLARMARGLALGSLLDLGHGARMQQMEENGTVLAQAFEALMGAILEDTDPATALAVVGHLFGSEIQASNPVVAAVATR